MSRTMPHTPRARRAAAAPRPWLDLAVLLASVLVLTVAVNVLASRPALRAQIDATKTRAYSLSDRTRTLLRSLEGPWTIALVMSGDTTDAATRRQIDEVLRRFADAAPDLTVTTIDPADPRAIAAYEALLADLRATFAEDVDAWDAALDRGVESFDALHAFAQQHAAALETAAAAAEQVGRRIAGLPQRARLLGLLAVQGEAVLEAVREARRPTASRPLPDYDGARSILADATAQWASELDTLAALFEDWSHDASLDENLRAYAQAAAPAYAQQAQDLAVAADALRRLDPLPLGTIGKQLEGGEAAIILAPHDAAVIPARQLMPMTNLRAGGDGAIAFDQRFRGEQVISAAIRSLTVAALPRVVFVHAQDGSMLTRRDKQADVFGLTLQLRAARFEVQQWNLAQSTERPDWDDDRPTAWVVLPPPARAGLQLSEREQRLVQATANLIDDGEPVLLSLHPSRLPRYGQPDPWAALPGRFGLAPDTARVVVQSQVASAEDTSIERGVVLRDYADDSPIGRALQGQQAYFALPVPVQPVPQDEAPAGVHHEVIAAVSPGPDRWLEREWMNDIDPSAANRELGAFDEPLPVAVAAERPHPAGPGEQRFIVVGSGGWMLSYIADVVVEVSAGRPALVNPGNYELAQASIAWLAGMDDLIAQGPTTRTADRIGGLTDAARRAWWSMLVLGVPAACLLAGVGVWFIRRRTS